MIAVNHIRKTVENSMKKQPSKKPPANVTDSVQFSLFGNSFVSNNDSEVTNTIKVWESIPKYFFSPHQMKKLRTADGLANPFKWEYTQKGKQGIEECMVVIQPALIEQKDGSYKAFFPGVTEELVEETLKKILCDQQYGLHDVANSETWVRFTLRLVQKHLGDHGKARRIPDITHAIQVMNKCTISYFVDGHEIWSGNILQDLVTVGREEYNADKNAHHIARFPVFVSKAINLLDYRQTSYNHLMSFDERASGWIYKRLSIRYTHANHFNTYHFMYSEITQSGLFLQGTERDNRKKMVSSLEELKNKKIIAEYVSDVRKVGAKIVDVKYTVTPTPEFIGEQKAANKRATDIRTIGNKMGLPYANR